MAKLVRVFVNRRHIAQAAKELEESSLGGYMFDEAIVDSPEDVKQEIGIKHDQEKVQLELFSARWLIGVGQVLTFGAKKYHAHNWRHGIQRSRLIGAALRHVVAYLGGEDFDPETGLLHLHHASCCLMFASELHFTRPDLDDRWKDLKNETPKTS